MQLGLECLHCPISSGLVRSFSFHTAQFILLLLVRFLYRFQLRADLNYLIVDVVSGISHSATQPILLLLLEVLDLCLSLLLGDAHALLHSANLVGCRAQILPDLVLEKFKLGIKLPVFEIGLPLIHFSILLLEAIYA